MFQITQTYANEIASFSLMITVINIILHFIFAGAVAKDAGRMTQVGERTLLVSGITWAFATLIGGVMIAAIYWFMHHSTLTRVTNNNITSTQKSF
ncbi:MAG: hypothetical protein Tsb005_03950 [Gammaproteobacteria bacterium]